MHILPLNHFENSPIGVKCLECGSSSVRIHYSDYTTFVGNTSTEATFTCRHCKTQESVDIRELEIANEG